MKEQLDKLLKSFREFWQAQEKKRKIIILSVTGGVLVLAIVLALVLNIQRNVVLYTGLDATEAGEIAAQIQEMGLTAEVTADGTISVPEKEENMLRMKLGTMGYPKSGLDYSLWDDKIDLFSTDYQKRMVAKQQLETRLIDTIETLEGVDKAIVTLDIPPQKDTVINVNKQPPTASVVLHLKGNTSLSDDQISGITNIVLNSVSGLSEGNVSITDGTGRVLAVGMDSAADEIVRDRNKLRFKNDLENGIKQSIYEMLLPAYTEKGVRVAVNAVLNYDEQFSDDTEYTPSHDDGSGMLQHKDEEHANSGTDPEGGVVGVEPNADTYPTGTVNGDGSGWYSDATSETYLVNTLKTQTKKSGYTIDQLTVSVMIYKEYVSDDERAAVISTVAGAAGVDPRFVSVGNIPRYEDVLEKPVLGYPFGLSTLQYYVVLGVLLILIIVFIFLYIMVSGKAKRKRRKLERAYMEATAAAAAQNMKNEEGGRFSAVVGDKDFKLPSLQEAANVETKEAAVRREIGSFADSSPDMVAQLLRNWIREDADKNG